MPRHLNIYLGNHSESSRVSLGDLCDWVRAGFTECGWTVSVEPQHIYAPPVVNLVFEWGIPGWEDVVADLAGKTTLGCFVTEIIDAGAGRFVDYGHWDGRDRYRVFEKTLGSFSFFITTVEANVATLARYAPTFFFEFGYSPLLLPAPVTTVDRLLTFCGHMTPFRHALIEEISRRVPVYVPGGFEAPHTAGSISTDAYLELYARSLVTLSLRQHADWPLATTPRMGRALHAKRGILSQQPEIHTALSRMIPMFVTAADVADYFSARTPDEILAEADRRLETYRAQLPLKPMVERMIDTILP
jgi:hypothetical protein